MNYSVLFSIYSIIQNYIEYDTREGGLSKYTPLMYRALPKKFPGGIFL